MFEMDTTEMSAAIIVGFLIITAIFIVPILFIKALRQNKILKSQLETAQKIANGVLDADQYSVEKHKEADQYFKNKKTESDALQTTISDLKKQKNVLISENKSLELEVYSNSVRIDAYESLKSDEIKNKLTMLRGQQDQMVKEEQALIVYSSVSSKKIVNSQKKQILRCFNSECANILDSVTVKNVDTCRAKIQRSFEVLNKLFEVDEVQISQTYLASKFEELSLIYSYMVKEEEEKEQKKAIREQMVEEEKVRREIEREKQKIEKEEAQFSNEIKKLMSYMQKARDDIERPIIY